MWFRGSLLVAAWLVPSSHGAPDPSEYFGGTNNEAYLAWVDTLVDKPSHAFIPTSWDPSKGAALHWAMTDDGYIELAVAVQATGWLGVGFSPVGGMIGADMLLVEAATPSIVIDAHVKSEQVKPFEDTCQDWEMTAGDAVVDSGFMMVQVRRLIKTSDTQDHPFINDKDVIVPPSHMIAAWGDDATVSYHGKNTARSAIRWFSDGVLEDEAFQMRMDEQSTGSMVLRREDYPVKVQETEYAYICFSSADLEELGNFSMEEGVYMIGMDAVIDKAKHVHHFILYGNTQDIDKTENFTCRIGLNGFFGDIAYPWAPGDPPFSFPDNVGMAVGGASDSGAFRSFMLETHYDNTDLVQNETDSSGVTLYFTTEPREHKAGILSVGDPFIALREQPIPIGLSDWQLSCPGSCASLAMATDESVTVLREFLHMHNDGHYISNEHSRNGEVIRTGRVEYWDFVQSGDPAVQQEPFEILPGDSFDVRCYYKNNNNMNKTFGFASSQEMCIAFLMYYPRKTITVQVSADTTFETHWSCGVGFAQFYNSETCDVSFNSAVLPEGVEPEVIFGSVAKTCDGGEPDTSGGGEPDDSGGEPDDSGVEPAPAPTSGSSRVAAQGLITVSILLMVFTHMAW